MWQMRFAAKPAPSGLQPTHSRPGAAHRSKAALLRLMQTSAALQQAAATLIATPKSS